MACPRIRRSRYRWMGYAIALRRVTSSGWFPALPLRSRRTCCTNSGRRRVQVPPSSARYRRSTTTIPIITSSAKSAAFPTSWRTFRPLTDCARNINPVTQSASARIRGQDSFLLNSSVVKLAITCAGGMLGPVTFFPHDSRPIEPYAIAPWAEEELPTETSTMITALRGDWFCSAFGENIEPWSGQHLPPHGETANGTWRGMERVTTKAGSGLRLAIDLPLQGGHVESMTALLADHPVVYQRHDLSGLTGPCNPGHHATLA